MHGRQITLPLLISFFCQLYYTVISLTSLKTTLPLCLLLSFLHNKHLVSTLRGRPIILYLLICLFYLLWLNIISLTSSKITLVLLSIAYFVQKMKFHFYLEKNWPSQNRSSRIVSASPDQYTKHFEILIYWNFICSYTLRVGFVHEFITCKPAVTHINNQGLTNL